MNSIFNDPGVLAPIQFGFTLVYHSLFRSSFGRAARYFLERTALPQTERAQLFANYTIASGGLLRR